MDMSFLYILLVLRLRYFLALHFGVSCELKLELGILRGELSSSNPMVRAAGAVSFLEYIY